jgi:hypothetical protein
MHEDIEMWIWNPEMRCIEQEPLHNLGLAKIFDEILVNARDQCVKLPVVMMVLIIQFPRLTYGFSTIGEEDKSLVVESKTISVCIRNNGTGVPVHPGTMSTSQSLSCRSSGRRNYRQRERIVGGGATIKQRLDVYLPANT